MKSTTADLCIDYSFKFLFISINHDLILNSQNQFTRFWGFTAYTRAATEETLRIGKNIDSLEEFIGRAYSQFKNVLKQSFLEEKRTYTIKPTQKTSQTKLDGFLSIFDSA